VLDLAQLSPAMPTFQELASRNAFKSHFQFGHAFPV